MTSRVPFWGPYHNRYQGWRSPNREAILVTIISKLYQSAAFRSRVMNPFESFKRNMQSNTGISALLHIGRWD